MKQIQFQNIYLKLKTAESKIAYTKQRNCCVSLITKGKKEYYGNQDVKDVKDNKKSFSDKKNAFSDKSKSRKTIALVKTKRLNLTK